jgi:hypothetical protein
MNATLVGLDRLVAQSGVDRRLVQLSGEDSGNWVVLEQKARFLRLERRPRLDPADHQL